MSAQGADTVRSTPAILFEAGLDRLVAMLAADGYRVIGPRLEAGAVTLGTIERAGDLALGVADAQAPGRYRAEMQGAAGTLAHAAPATPWKRFLYPPDERLFVARRSGDGFDIDAAEPGDDEPPLALFAIRPCDLAAVAVLDAVLADDARTADRRLPGAARADLRHCRRLRPRRRNLLLRLDGDRAPGRPPASTWS